MPNCQQAVYVLIVAAMALAACGSDEELADTTDSGETQVASTDPPATDPPTASEPVIYAEGVIDSFYGYDPAPLEAAVAGIEGAEFVLYYQGWAEGANYEVLNRAPCEERGDEVVCDITVKDDFIAALGIDFDVTDSFHFQFDDDGKATAVYTTSNDPPAFGMAFEWMFEQKPELGEAECEGFFDGGPTPGACAEQVVAAFAEYASLQDDAG